MGEINLIPGQQVRGQKRSGGQTAGDVEYTHPDKERIPAPSLIPVAVKPPKESWWQRRKLRRAAKLARKQEAREQLAAQRVAQAKALAERQTAQQAAQGQATARKSAQAVPKAKPSGQASVPAAAASQPQAKPPVPSPKPPAPALRPPTPLRPLAIDVNLLPHEKGGGTNRNAAQSTPPVPAHIQAEPDFLSDAGFRSNSLPPSEAYSIRRTKRTSPAHSPKRKDAPTGKQPARHEAEGKPAELLDVNLIPKEFDQADRPKHSFLELIWYGLTAALIVGAVYGGLQWWEFNLTQKSSDLRQQVALLDGQISNYTEERQTASELQTTLQGLNTVLNQHVTYDKFFDFLEDNTLPSVYYKNINVDARSGVVTAAAVTADFEQLRAQEAVFLSSPVVTGVTITSATRTVPTTPTVEDGAAEDTGPESTIAPVLFNLSLSLDTSVFHP